LNGDGVKLRVKDPMLYVIVVPGRSYMLIVGSASKYADSWACDRSNVAENE